MEKIKYKPLIEHLANSGDDYNQLYRDLEIRNGAIDPALISWWLANVIEPVLIETTSRNTERLPQVFKAFFAQLLQILSNRSGIVNESEYQHAWQLCSLVPSLTVLYPERMLKAINSAIETIRMYQSAKTHTWIELMGKTAGTISTVDEFMACGRIFAWLCGLAHLRSRAKSCYNGLSPELKMKIRDSFDPNKSIEDFLGHFWPSLSQPEFVGEAGGFIGYGGPFMAPPQVSLIENEFLVTDNNTSTAFFADEFGKVFLTEIPVSPAMIKKNAGTGNLGRIKQEFGHKLIPFEDITSVAIKDSTLVITRSSSHYIYVYGYRI